MGREEDILIRGDQHLPKVFFPLLEKGVQIDVVVGKTISRLLTDQLEIEPAYIEDKIQTIFLNSKAVDDPDQTVVNDGDLLALSGAMPGVVGATLRKKGRYAAMRKEISAAPIFASSPQFSGRIGLKLFNNILSDLGPKMLASGLVVLGADLIDVLNRAQAGLNPKNISIYWGPGKTSLGNLLGMEETRNHFRLRVIF